MLRASCPWILCTGPLESSRWPSLPELLAGCRQVLEVVAEPEEPLKSYEELLKELPSEYPQAERVAAVQAAETAVQQLEAAREKVIKAFTLRNSLLLHSARLAGSLSMLCASMEFGRRVMCRVRQRKQMLLQQDSGWAH